MGLAFIYPRLPLDRPSWGLLRLDTIRDALPEKGLVNKENVVRTRGQVSEAQDWLETEFVTRVPESDAAKATKQQVIDTMRSLGHQDVTFNLMWGTTKSNRTPRWILIE
jgi:hypothetical protein